jgi:hypothetical protein
MLYIVVVIRPLPPCAAGSRHAGTGSYVPDASMLMEVQVRHRCCLAGTTPADSFTLLTAGSYAAVHNINLLSRPGY